jgi:4-hydroxybenzoate polyprenyltransferase
MLKNKNIDNPVYNGLNAPNPINTVNSFHNPGQQERFYNFISFLSISSIIVALVGFFVPYITFALYNIDMNFDLLLASFLIAFSVYSLDKLLNLEEDSISLPQRARFINQHKKLFTYATVAAYAFAIVLSGLKNILALLVILSPLLIGLLYSLKIANMRLKDIPILKNISISASWAIVGTFLPLAVTFEQHLIEITLIFYLCFIKCFINTVIFDVRDIEGDRANKVRTIPVILGLKTTKILLIILNSTLIIWLIICYFGGFFHQYLFILILSVFYSFWYILYFSRKNTEIGKSIDLFVDGEWIYIGIGIFVVKIFLS